MNLNSLSSPITFLRESIDDASIASLQDYESWWMTEGMEISAAVDRAGTPWLRMFDELGNRVDELLFPPEYWRMLQQGYATGAIWRPFADDSLKAHYLIDYVTCFFDAGLACPYIVSLSTAIPLSKYGTPALQNSFLHLLLKRDGSNWQGATWMTEAKGGSDLGTSVETIAQQQGDRWVLTGDKYFASNVGAEIAIVAARPAGAPQTPRGLALFLVPRRREDGRLNYFIRRLKNKIGTRSVPTGEVELRDSEAFLLGDANSGIYLILESLNLSRVGNIAGSVALAQRALADAFAFAQQRSAFGKPIIDHPLLKQQFVERADQLINARALMWQAIELLDEVWKERPPYSDRYHLFRLVAHLAKYWTAELAVQFAKWNMEVHAGAGVLAEHRAERWLRDAMILPIWEGTPHRQMLDGLEVMERKGAHQSLFDLLTPHADAHELKEMAQRTETHLQLPAKEREAQIERLFIDLAEFTARSLRKK
jgi:alkylation response protein AidB-like acyl-CoA dehydrogenase